MISPNRNNVEVNHVDVVELPANIPGIDLLAGLKIVQQNKTLYIKLLRKFVETQQDFATEFEQAMQQGDYERMMHISHNLKGVSANLGMMELHRDSGLLEQACEKNTAEIMPLFTATAKGVERVINGISLCFNLAPYDIPDVQVDTVKSTLRQLLKQVQSFSLNSLEVVGKLEALLKDQEQKQSVMLMAQAIKSYNFNEAESQIRKFSRFYKIDL